MFHYVWTMVLIVISNTLYLIMHIIHALSIANPIAPKNLN